jgi:NitT/TauT family transport system ATP-binding protein
VIEVRCEEVGHAYPSADGPVAALEGVSFEGRGQEIISIVGPSGCGKTTLLKLLAGILEPSAGLIRYASPNGRAPRNALVFQDHGVFPWLTVVDNVAFGLEMQGVNRTECRERAARFLDRIGLAGFARRYPNELSVGMRQRVGIARAFVSDAEVLLMDEPFGSLDAQTRILLQEELLEIWQEDRKLVVFVTHDIDEAILLGDRVLVMSGRPGRILEEIAVSLPRPRTLEGPDRPDITEVKWHIWSLLEAEVRRHLSIRT